MFGAYASFAVLDPELTASVPAMQVRSNLMWDSAMADNGILKAGRVTDFQAHQIEHQLGAFTGTM